MIQYRDAAETYVNFVLGYYNLEDVKCICKTLKFPSEFLKLMIFIDRHFKYMKKDLKKNMNYERARLLLADLVTGGVNVNNVNYRLNQEANEYIKKYIPDIPEEIINIQNDINRMDSIYKNKY